MAEHDRPSHAPAWWARLSTTWKALGAIATAVGLVWTAALAYAAKSAEYATDVEVDARVEAVERKVIAVEQTAATRDDLARQFGALRMDADQRDKAQRAESEAIFEMMVSGFAADMQGNRLLKADSAAAARVDFQDAIAKGMPPAKAAAYARDRISQRSRIRR